MQDSQDNLIYKITEMKSDMNKINSDINEIETNTTQAINQSNTQANGQHLEYIEHKVTTLV